MISLLAVAALAAPCPAPTTAIDMVAAIGTAEMAFIDVDIEKFETARTGAEHALNCLGEPLYPPDAAAWHRLEAMAAFIKKDDAASIAAYRSSFALQPDYKLPERIAPTGHPLRSWFDAARVLPPTTNTALPAGGPALYVDGTRAANYPADRPFVLQAMDPAGRIQATAAVAANGALPSWAAAIASAPVATTTVTTAPSGTFGSASIASIAEGTPFTIRDVHTDDAYVSDKSTIVGLSCTAGAGMTRTDGAWWGGAATCNGNPFYFYKMAFDVTGSAPASVASSGAGTPDVLYAPTTVKIRDVNTDDLYYSQRGTLAGQTCTIAGELHRNDGAWYGGDVTCADGTYYYFYKVAFDVVGTAYTTQTTAEITAGSNLVIQDIAPDDAYYNDRASIIGQSCTVASSLQANDGDWYGGDVNCSNGSYYYFYKMKFTSGGTGAGTTGTTGDGRFTGYYVPKKAWVSIVDVSDADAFSGYKSILIGQSCQVKQELSGAGDGWFSGELKCGTSKLYFYQVAVIY